MWRRRRRCRRPTWAGDRGTRPRRSRPGGPPRPLPRAPVDARARLEELLALGDGVLVRPEPDVGIAEAQRLTVTELACAPDRPHRALDRERRLRCDRVRRPRGALVQLLLGHDLGD